MQVRVKSLQGDEYLIHVQNEHTVHQLKASISEKANGLPVDRQKLVYKGRTMQDTSLVSEYNLEDDCKVHLIVQKKQESSSPVKEGSSPREANTSASVATSATSPPDSNQSSNSQCPMEVSPDNLKNSQEMIKRLGQWGSAVGGETSEKRVNDDNSDNNIRSKSTSNDNNKNNHRPKSRFEVILRESLAAHFPSGSIDRIIENLYQEIDADINSSSLDDLERLAKQKLNITNE